MTRIGLSIEELVATTWTGERLPQYVARADGLDLLAGEVVALVGPGAAALRQRIQASTETCAPIDGPLAAGTATLRVEARRAARAGWQAVAVSDPLVDGLDGDAASLAIADLASIAALGLAAVVDLVDAQVAALVADRVAVVEDGRVDRSYPVLAPRPRRAEDVEPVTERTLARLAAS